MRGPHKTDAFYCSAEGNPDEEKIGAFGVGFYSVFSVTEGPFVTSGGQWMGFHWKDERDQVCSLVVLAGRKGADIQPVVRSSW